MAWERVRVWTATYNSNNNSVSVSYDRKELEAQKLTGSGKLEIEAEAAWQAAVVCAENKRGLSALTAGKGQNFTGTCGLKHTAQTIQELKESRFAMVCVEEPLKKGAAANEFGIKCYTTRNQDAEVKEGELAPEGKFLEINVAALAFAEERCESKGISMDKKPSFRGKTEKDNVEPSEKRGIVYHLKSRSTTDQTR